MLFFSVYTVLHVTWHVAFISGNNVTSSDVVCALVWCNQSYGSALDIKLNNKRRQLKGHGTKKWIIAGKLACGLCSCVCLSKLKHSSTDVRKLLSLYHKQSFVLFFSCGDNTIVKKRIRLSWAVEDEPAGIFVHIWIIMMMKMHIPVGFYETSLSCQCCTIYSWLILIWSYS